MNKKIYEIFSALMIMLIAGSMIGAAASTLKIVQKNAGSSAYGEWLNPNINYTFISAAQSNTGTDVFVQICTSVQESASCKWGSSSTTENVLTVDKKLNTASLNIKTMQVSNSWCDEFLCYESSETLNNIQVQWNGIGEIRDGSYRYSSKYDNIVFKASSSSFDRNAVATGSINGISIGESTFGNIGQFKSASTETHKQVRS